jgi:hypothetical protein
MHASMHASTHALRIVYAAHHTHVNGAGALHHGADASELRFWRRQQLVAQRHGFHEEVGIVPMAVSALPMRVLPRWNLWLQWLSFLAQQMRLAYSHTMSPMHLFVQKQHKMHGKCSQAMLVPPSNRSCAALLVPPSNVQMLMTHTCICTPAQYRTRPCVCSLPCSHTRSAKRTQHSTFRLILLRTHVAPHVQVLHIFPHAGRGMA